jgi:hypothetical protein
LQVPEGVQNMHDSTLLARVTDELAQYTKSVIKQ